MEATRIPIPVYARITCRKHSDQEIYKDPSTFTTNEFMLTDLFSDVLVSVFFSLSLRHKLWIMIATYYETVPAATWV